MRICGKDIAVLGHFPRIAKIAGEGFQFFENPEAVVSALRVRGGVDVFTFAQRLPHTEPRHPYPMELDNVAALPISTFDHWWTKQISGKTRNMVRVAEKKGISVAEASFDDAFARGIWEIYNETPIRQGRRFPHFGKDFEAVRAMSATFLDKSIFIGAFFDGELIGFAKLTIDDARSQAAVMHILGMLRHRDKSVTNALIAQCVRSCEQRNIPYIVYSNFSYGNKKTDSLAEFKERNGFQRFDLPRYYVPITAAGRLALKLGLHRSLSNYVPEALLAKYRQYRTKWYLRKLGAAAS